MGPIRQLAAIMFTDIQGYTRLMQQDEQQAVQLREKHRHIFNTVTKAHKGKILQYYGDGTLSIFTSAIDAVNCAIEMQKGFRKDQVIPVRIGIHTGDIMYSDEEIIGDGVNVASRIESLALAGSVLISEKVFDEIKNQPAIQSRFLKSVQLKNVEKPLDIYAVCNDGLIIPEANNIIGLSKTAAEKTIAVLPFVNMSNDTEQEYFSDGISEEILNALTNVEGLKVAGRTSSFSFKNKNEDIRVIGEKLNVTMVLEGSVRKEGKQLRITAQLINVADGFHLWSETYDRQMENVFAIQEDIALHISKKLRLQVQKSYKSQTKNMEAYDLVLRGIQLLRKDEEETKKAMQAFREAVELDPAYAEAHACLAECYLTFAGYNLMPAVDANSKARIIANTALSLNKYEPRAHMVFAFIHLFYDWDWESTRTAYNRAIEYGFPEQNAFITYYHLFLFKDNERAIAISRQRVESDPLHAETHWQLGICYFFAGDFEAALTAYNKALMLDPQYGNCHMWKGTALAYLGRFDEAMASIEKSLEISGGSGLALLERILVKILMGKREEALSDIRSQSYIDSMDAARLYTVLNMPDEALKWLKQGYQERSGMMITIAHNWVWDPLRSDARFREIYQKMNFPE